jgi:SAM-dependent methyltransferase
MECIVCGGESWAVIPDPVPNRSITTAAIIIDRGLGKSQCMACGFVARTGDVFVGNSDYYEEKYADYYRRPGAEVYDAHRYDIMATWLAGALGAFVPERIVDVGCGAGWSLSAMRTRYPDATFDGIEPSKANSALARARGFDVRNFKVGAAAADASGYDLVYSKNVLTHVLDPRGFFAGLKDMLRSGGRIAIITVDGTVPSSEMLWVDNNYSYLPIHVLRLAEQAGLVPLHFERNPPDITILNKQLMVFGESGTPDDTIAGLLRERVDPERIYAERVAYMRAWRNINDQLADDVRGCTRVVNFGASMWTWLLAGFCPDYWSRVDECTVDGFGGRCVDKPVVAFEEMNLGAGDALVLGLNPVTQDRFIRRFAGGPFRVVRWDHQVQI